MKRWALDWRGPGGMFGRERGRGLKPIDHKAKAKRAALNALRRARRAADAAGVKLSDWEGEFLGSVEGRVEKYGRAFADPDLGAMNGALSLRQGVKLKEIAAKTRRKDSEGDARTAKPDRPDKPAKTSGFGTRKSGFGKARAGKSGFGKPKSGGPKSGGPKSGGPKSGGPKSGGPKSGGPKRYSSFTKRSGKLHGK